MLPGAGVFDRRESDIRVEADLVDQLFNSSEKRLARTLLLAPLFAPGTTRDSPSGVAMSARPETE
jgi:hypothetical protein